MKRREMFIFKNDQQVADIGGVKIGGQPGEYSTALGGTIFYSGHKIVTSHEQGLFDRQKAKELIETAEYWAGKTKNPFMIHIYGQSRTALERYIDFVEPFEQPIILDSSVAELRLHGLEYADQLGLLDRTVYNSLGFSITQKEIDGLKFLKPSSAILLLYNPSGNSVQQKLDLIEKNIVLGTNLLDIAKSVGIKNLLIDTAATPFAAGSDFLRACLAVKAKHGLPAGAGMHNVSSTWEWFSQLSGDEQKDTFKLVDSSSSALQSMFSDFVLFGPIENAKRVFPTVAFANNLLTNMNKDFFDGKRKML